MPPFVGVAVNVTEAPAQTGFWDGVILTLTGSSGITTIVIIFEVSGLFMMHPVIDDVNMHLTRSLFTGG